MIAIRTFANWEVGFLTAAEFQRREEEFAKNLADLTKLVGELEEVIKAARATPHRASLKRGLSVLG